MLRLPLVLLVLAQINLPQPSFAYSDGTACGDRVLTVVLREVTFKASGRRFTVPRVLRVTAGLNNTVAG